VYCTAYERCGLDGATLIETERDPLIGKLVEQYVIVERLGKGAIGLVYRAVHTELDHDHALKIMFGEFASDNEIAERFRREGRALSRMSHPNIVSVRDFGRTQSGLLYLSMELVRGETLSTLLTREKRLSRERTIAMGKQIAAGLEHAHSLGYVHRDLKPSNMMIVNQRGTELVKILDFGLVGVADTHRVSTTSAPLTKVGTLLGTPIYMAPEQMRDAQVGPAADIYSLGATMYELISGTAPITGSAVSVLSRKLSEQIPPLPDHDGLGPLIHRMLSTDPADRPSSARAVIDAIEALPASRAARFEATVRVPSPFGPTEITEATELPVIEPGVPVRMGLEETMTTSEVSSGSLRRALEPTVISSAVKPPFVLEGTAPRIDELPPEVGPPPPLDFGTQAPLESLVVKPVERPKSLYLIAGFAAIAVAVVVAVTATIFEPEPRELRGQPIATDQDEDEDVADEAEDEAIDPSVPGPEAQLVPGEDVRESVAAPSKSKRVSKQKSAPSAESIRRRLDRLSTNLASMAGAVPDEKLASIEDRYFGLSRELRAGMSDDQYRDLSRRLRKLERDLDSIRNTKNRSR
jgi:eukaryotic-like serine/threonine-protein kinase